jgi:hypothetical protein
MQEPGCLQYFIHGYTSPIIPWSCAGFYEWLVVMLMMLLLELDQLLLALALLLPVACPAPSCAWLSSLPALHLLGAWPAPCCFWSCLSNHVDWLWLWVLIWWGEFPPWCSAHEQGELGECSVLVLWCWCCGAVVLVLWCWSIRVSGRPVLHTQYYFIPPPGFWCIDTSLHTFDDQLLASWVAWPARLVLGKYLCVWVMLIRSTLWWLSTVFPF